MKFTIIGAGNSGQSMAAHLTLLGYNISLYDIQESLIEGINEKGGIEVEGFIQGFAPVKATTNLENAMENTDVIMITTTGSAHRTVARAIAPYLQDGQVIMLCPGYWGALECRSIFRDMGMNKKVYVAETESFIYTCHSTAPGHVQIRKIKESLEFSALPSSDSAIVKDRLSEVYPQLKIAGSVLVTTLNNCNPILHVPIALLNAGRIESEGEFAFFLEGATPSVVNVVEELEQERLVMGRHLGIKLSPALDLLRRFYRVEATTLYKSIQKNPVYQCEKAPVTLNHRYIYEDIPYGLHPMVELGEKLGIHMRCCNLLIDMASLLVKEDLRERAVRLSDLGLADMNPDEIVAYLEE
ncbi:NAD/NADP octopine/nopaline dehydrogenase family protein [Siminovitchia sp. FSL H7-0308]|uniref:Opine dehydrogenase n=1 Tax=Siminovitchia thermophila TaxID=1245522 RepID=A0ABS2R8T2_9BACI|nr:NAD/NADP-dependent octopine/nopaline dehydrogenase family protein [Siminovitchia thermophila]MBM7715006.1 opine dehydrogenase [Siminovitchia thermophila]